MHPTRLQATAGLVALVLSVGTTTVAIAAGWWASETWAAIGSMVQAIAVVGALGYAAVEYRRARGEPSERVRIDALERLAEMLRTNVQPQLRTALRAPEGLRVALNVWTDIGRPPSPGEVFKYRFVGDSVTDCALLLEAAMDEATVVGDAALVEVLREAISELLLGHVALVGRIAAWSDDHLPTATGIVPEGEDLPIDAVVADSHAADEALGRAHDAFQRARRMVLAHRRQVVTEARRRSSPTAAS